MRVPRSRFHCVGFPLSGFSVFTCNNLSVHTLTCGSGGVVCADSGPVVAVASDLIGENPDSQHGVIPGFKGYFR